MIDYDNTIFIHHHLGLGDHVVCNGMVRFCLKNLGSSKVRVVVKNKYVDSVSQMYRDERNIELQPVETDSNFYNLPLEWNKVKLVRAGFEKCRRIDWAVSLYDSVGISFNERWDSFYYERNKQEEEKLVQTINPPERFALVHNVSSVGKFDLKLDTDLPIINVSPVDGFGVFSWLGMVERAQEVHCIDSSFAHLVESFFGINKNLNFHDVKNDGVIFSRKQQWNFIKYGESR